MRNCLYNFILILSCIFLSYANVLERFQDVKKEELQFSPTCISCTVAVSAMSFILKFDASEPVVLKLATVICKLFAKESWVVCNGISGQFREEFFYVFRRLSSSSPSQICGILLPDCADPTDISEAGWTVDLPPKSQRIRVKASKRDSKSLRVLQLSDLHVDFEYKEGSEANCGLPVCCRTLVDNPLEAAGYWGTVGDCDIPLRTLDNMLQHINSTEKLDYILMSGDYINHVDWTYSKESHIETLQRIDTLVKGYFPKTPIYWALGNHEGVPVNSFAPHTVEKRFWPTWLYKQMNNMSSPWLDKTATNTILYRGSYVTEVVSGLKLISLNTGFCETTNFFLYLNQSDPDGTMSWLVEQLYQAEKNADYVHIMAHIPPGNEECLEGWARNYYRVVQRFASTIKAQFFGHVHLDYFTVFYSDMHNVSSEAIGVAYAAPSVTTFSYMNPAYRIYDIDVANDFEISDFHTYSADLSKSSKNVPPTWKLLYSAKNFFGMKNLLPSSWNDAITQLFNDDNKFQQYLSYSYRTADPSCGLRCQYSFLCSLRMGHHNSSLYCPDPFENKQHTIDNRVPVY